jgi:membrane-bound lytic murein transglycosylase D
MAGLDIDEFKHLNPQMNRPVILAAGTPQILLPYDNANRFVHELLAHEGPLSTWTAWVVPKTMRSADAAKLVDMSEDELRDVNRIPPRMMVRVGSTLLVPRNGHADVSEHIAEHATMTLAPDGPARRRVTLRAGKRDSVASIARRYRIGADQVAAWNGVGPGTRFARGQKVVVYVKTSAKAKSKVRRGHATRTRTAKSKSSGAKTKVAQPSRAKPAVRMSKSSKTSVRASTGE